MADLLAILGAGPDQLPAYEQAAQLGVQTLAIDMNPDAVAMSRADFKLVESTKNIPALVDKLKQFQSNTKPINGVMTIAAEVSPSVAAIASALNLPGVSEAVAHLTTNKCARAERFREKGIPFPHFQIGSRREDFTQVQYPVVIKPSDNSASRGVRLIGNDQELNEFFSTAHALSGDGQVILEDYIPGAQVSIEGMVLEGKLWVTGFADRNYSRNAEFYPYFVEDGGDIPSRLSAEVQAQVKETFARAVQALGIWSGPTKGDVIIDDNGRIYIIEVTSRLSGGGFCSRTVPLTSGVNIVRTTIQVALGYAVDSQDLIPKFQRAMCHRFYFHQPGIIREINGFEALVDQTGVAAVVVQRPFQVGDRLEPVTYANRLFYLITVNGDAEVAREQAERSINSVSLKMD